MNPLFPTTPALIKALVPTGKLRASINLGNPILAQRLAATGEVSGVSVDLARGLAQWLGVEAELVVFDAAGKSVEAVEQERADIGFFAIDPKRGEKIAFTAAYVDIEGAYLVASNSPLTANEQVDKAGVRVTVGLNSAYDLYLSRELKHATLERAPTSPKVVDTFLSSKADVAAGVKQQLEQDMKRLAGTQASSTELRLLPGRFMVISQAMGLPKSRGMEAATALKHYVEHMKTSGFVAQALAQHKVEGAVVSAAVHVTS